MTEKRESGWYYVSLDDDDPWYQGMTPAHLSANGKWDMYVCPVEPTVIGERIPTNDELKALWSVVEAARKAIEGVSWTGGNLLLKGEKELRDALARLGERK